MRARIAGVVGPAIAALSVGTAVLALGACSGGSHSPAATASTTLPPTTSTSAPTTTEPASTAPASTEPGTLPATTAPTTTASSHVSITGVAVSPPSPVSCTADTQIELRWTANGAAKVDLAIDGAFFASYGPGAQDHLEYLACDGRTHRYTLTARAGTTTAIATVDVATRRA